MRFCSIPNTRHPKYYYGEIPDHGGQGIDEVESEVLLLSSASGVISNN